MRHPWVAFIIGVISFPLLFLIGESLGLTAAYAFLAVYFFTWQFVLSHGNPAALREDWRLMLALDAVPLGLFLVTVLAETREVILSQGLPTVLACCGGTLAGVAAATIEAHRPHEHSTAAAGPGSGPPAH